MNKSNFLLAFFLWSISAQSHEITCDMVDVQAKPWSSFKFEVGGVSLGSISEAQFSRYPQDQKISNGNYRILAGCENAKINKSPSHDFFELHCVNSVEVYIARTRIGRSLLEGNIFVRGQWVQIICMNGSN